MRRSLMLLLLSLLFHAAHAQLLPERKVMRSGNKQYEKGDYAGAEKKYREGLEKNPASYEGIFNLGDALYCQDRFEESEALFEQLGQAANLPDTWSKTFFNQGNSQFRQRKLQEALESYKNAMRLNPDDQEAKFNYAYTKKLLEDEQGDGGGDGDDDGEGEDDQDQDQDQDGDGESDGENDPNEDEGDNNDQDGDNEPDEQPQQEQPQEYSISPEEAERMLNAVQNSEDQTREKVDAQQAEPVRSGKNW